MPSCHGPSLVFQRQSVKDHTGDYTLAKLPFYLAKKKLFLTIKQANNQISVKSYNIWVFMPSFKLL